MRIALATGLLPVPPTYFALQHGERLQAEHEVRMFTIAADIRDPAVSIEVDAALPSVGPWPARIAAAFATAPLSSAVQARRIAAFAPDVVHVAAPFLLGGKAIAVCARAGIPSVAIYQTDVAGYLQRYGVGFARPMLDRFVAGVHALAGRTLAPTPGTAGATSTRRR